MGRVTWSTLKNSKWQQINGTISDRYRTWVDSGIQILHPPADAIGVTESVHIDLYKPVNATNSVGITELIAQVRAYARTSTDTFSVPESLSKAVAYAFTNSVGITESVAVVKAIVQAATDSLGITEAVALAMRLAESYTDTFHLPETLSYRFTSVRNEYVELYDSIALKPNMVFTNSVGITDSIASAFTRAYSATNSVGITDSHSYAVSWHFTESAGVTESVAFGRTWHDTESIGITESATAAIAITESASDTFSITEEFSTLVYDFSINDLSIVDIARINAATYFGLTADSIKALSINDLGHMYWANKDLHLSDRQYQSIMDYFRAVSPNGKHWVTDIEET